MIVMAFKQEDGTFRLEADHQVVAQGFRRPMDAVTWGERNGYVGEDTATAERHLHDTGTPATTERYGHDGHTLAPSAAHMEALGWAFTHPPTQEAYRRSTGEDLAPALRRYQEWVEENIIGSEA